MCTTSLADQDAVSWHTWIRELRLISEDLSYALRIVSWIFLVFALVPIAPIAGLVLYDIALWMWRLVVSERDVTQQNTPDTNDAAAASETPPRPRENGHRSVNGSVRKKDDWSCH
ncbi:hypothetical protein B0T17DRAFT_167794 [Bombardia bombarda]|uniref:Uncharacterized protein n=1 Tax=Bombardia bombarda TaxID=252184 RepID=A0AA40C8T1_9PEZI|nr:hypothetical protein B0T17DRAFT_167794 [Bombardia bombarda]